MRLPSQYPAHSAQSAQQVKPYPVSGWLWVSSTVGKNFLCQKRKLLSFLKKLGVTKLLIHAMLIQYILIRISDWIRTAPEIPDADIFGLDIHSSLRGHGISGYFLGLTKPKWLSKLQMDRLVITQLTRLFWLWHHSHPISSMIIIGWHQYQVDRELGRAKVFTNIIGFESNLPKLKKIQSHKRSWKPSMINIDSEGKREAIQKRQSEFIVNL